jgi:hypothetical protein
MIQIFKRLRSFLFYHTMLFVNYILVVTSLNAISINIVVCSSLVASYLLTGFSAFLLNDYYDKEIDQKAGKYNLASNVNRYLIVFLIIVGFVVSFLFINRLLHYAGLILIAQVLALIAYSHPFVRLKTKPILGIITDSIYAYTLPVLLLFVLFDVELTDSKTLVFLLFNFSVGLREILLHQKEDELNDLKSGVKSFAIHHKTILKPVVYFFELIASFSLGFILITTFWNSDTQYYFIGITVAYALLLIVQLFKIQKSVENNYLMRFYIVVSSFIIIDRLIDQNQYVYLILLIHPYLIQFFIQVIQFLNQLKIMVAVIVNYSLYYSFKLVGRDLKEKPLFKRNHSTKG